MLKTGYFVHNLAASTVYFCSIQGTNPDPPGGTVWYPSTLVGGVLKRCGHDNIQIYGPAAKLHQEQFEAFLSCGEVLCDGWEEMEYSTPIYPYTVVAENKEYEKSYLILCETIDQRDRTVPHRIAFGDVYPQTE
jgi:hypothetical protein